MYASFVGHYVWRRVGTFQRFGSFQQNSLQLVVMAVTWASLLIACDQDQRYSNIFIPVAVCLRFESGAFPLPGR